MTATWEDCSIRLPGGRMLSYAVRGDPKGPPVVLMHGWPGSRLDGRLVEAAVDAKGIRLVVPDRPGIGRSDPLPGRTLLAWPGDVEALAGSLGLERFAVIGYSGGAPYAMACAYRLQGRMSGVALVSGMAPVDTMRAILSLPPHLSAVFALCRRAPSFALLSTGLIALGVRHFPEAMVRQARLTSTGADRDVLSRASVRDALKTGYREAFRQGVENVAHEASLLARPWGFPLNALRPGIFLYHGEADRFVPVALARLLNEVLPGCTCRLIPGAGHFWIVDHLGEVLDDLNRAHLSRPSG